MTIPAVQNPIPRLVGTVILAVSFASCAGPYPMSIESANGPAAPLSGFGARWAWAPESAVSHGEVQLPAEVGALVCDTLESVLAGKGYSRVDAALADFLVDFRGATRVMMEKPAWDVIPYTEGSLTVYVADPTSLTLMWQGVARAKIDPNDAPEVRRGRIEAAVSRILERFPSRQP